MEISCKIEANFETPVPAATMIVFLLSNILSLEDPYGPSILMLSLSKVLLFTIVTVLSYIFLGHASLAFKLSVTSLLFSVLTILNGYHSSLDIHGQLI